MRCLHLSRLLNAALFYKNSANRRHRILLQLLGAALLTLLLLKAASHLLGAAGIMSDNYIAGEFIFQYACNGKPDARPEVAESGSFIEETLQPELRPRTQVPTVCLNEECRVAYVKHFHPLRRGAYPIPAIRHILWRNESVSNYFAAQLRTWQVIHPDWTYVLWRDEDLAPFVADHYPGLLAKFVALPEQIMRVDMIRYLLLFKYGGVYADLDYRLVRSLDTFRRFHSVLTREPDAHSLQFRSMSWPVKPLANPAFLMSAPGHPFFLYIIQELMKATAGSVLDFAGPFGLTCMMESYMRLLPVAPHAAATVYVPPSRSFYPYPRNRINASRTDTVPYRLELLARKCRSLMTSSEPRDPHLRRYCRDVNNLDPITERSQPVYAIHDLKKAGGIWYGKLGHSLYTTNMTDMRLALRNLTLGIDLP